MQQATPVSSLSGTLRFALRRFILTNYIGWLTVLVVVALIDFATPFDHVANTFALLPFCAWFSNQFVWYWSKEDGCMQPSDLWVIAAPVLGGLVFAFLGSIPKGSGLTSVYSVYVCIALFFGSQVLRNRRAGALKYATNERLGYS